MKFHAQHQNYEQPKTKLSPQAALFWQRTVAMQGGFNTIESCMKTRKIQYQLKHPTKHRPFGSTTKSSINHLASSKSVKKTVKSDELIIHIYIHFLLCRSTEFVDVKWNHPSPKRQKLVNFLFLADDWTNRCIV